MNRKNRRALRRLKNPELAKENINNAAVQRLYRIFEKAEDDEDFEAKAKEFLKHALPQLGLKPLPKPHFYRSIFGQLRMAKYKGLDDPSLKAIVEKARVEGAGHDLESDEELKAKYGKDADREFRLTSPSETEREPKVVKKAKSSKDTKDVTTKGNWIIKFSEFPEKDGKKLSGEVDAKHLFNDVLHNNKLIKKNEKDTIKVMAIQNFLKKEGFLTGTGAAGKVDGDFADGTHKAVEAYQVAKELTKDGKVGRQTISQMFLDVTKDPSKHKIPITGKEMSSEDKEELTRRLKDDENVTVTSGTDVEWEEIDRDVNENVRKIKETKLRQIVRHALLMTKI